MEKRSTQSLKRLMRATAPMARPAASILADKDRGEKERYLLLWRVHDLLGRLL
jgi:hypothetical protein